jgi:molybdate transport system ATP-binding protein
LDNYQCRLVKDIIEVFCERMDKTLIMVTHYPEELPSCITNTLHIRKN